MTSPRILGIDVGGTGIKMGAVLAGDPPQVLETDLLLQEVDRPPAATMALVGQRLRAIMSASGWDGVDGIGIGSAGLIERDRGRIAFSPNLPAWTGAPLRELFAKEFRVPVSVDNDVNAFALSEWRWGAGERAQDAVFLTVGTGIGGAVIADGSLIRGARGFAGEPGHATLILDGIPCPCGNRGCAERYVGVEGLVAAARRHPGFESDPLSESDSLAPEDLTRAAAGGSHLAREVLEQAGIALGGLLVTLVNIFNPERVVIGGGIAQAGSFLLDPAKAHLARCSLVARHDPPAVLSAALGEHAGILGAAALVLVDEESAART